MTKEDAICFLNQLRAVLLNSNSWLESTHQPIKDAFDMAIKAIKESERPKRTFFGYQPTDGLSVPPSPPTSGSNIVQLQNNTSAKEDILDILLEALDCDSPLVFYDDDHGFCINTQDACDAILNRLQENDK